MAVFGRGRVDLRPLNRQPGIKPPLPPVPDLAGAAAAGEFGTVGVLTEVDRVGAAGPGDVLRQRDALSSRWPAIAPPLKLGAQIQQPRFAALNARPCLGCRNARHAAHEFMSIIGFGGEDGAAATMRISPARRDPVKPSIGLEPMTPSLPWKCSTN